MYFPKQVMKIRLHHIIWKQEIHIHSLLDMMQTGSIYLEFVQIIIQSMTSNWILHLKVASGVNNRGKKNYLEHKLGCNELLDW